MRDPNGKVISNSPNNALLRRFVDSRERHDWKDYVEYNRGDVIHFKDRFYVAISKNIKSKPDTLIHWNKL